VGHTSEQCCEPKTCQQIKDYIGSQPGGDEYCPGNIKYSIKDHSRISNRFGESGLGVCYKPSSLSDTIPVDKLEGYQWEKICCGPSKIEEQNKTIETGCIWDSNVGNWRDGSCNNEIYVESKFEARCRWVPDCTRSVSLPKDGECPGTTEEEETLQDELEQKLGIIKIRDPNFEECSLDSTPQIMGGCNEGGTSSNAWYTDNVFLDSNLYSLLNY